MSASEHKKRSKTSRPVEHPPNHQNHIAICFIFHKRRVILDEFFRKLIPSRHSVGHVGRLVYGVFLPAVTFRAIRAAWFDQQQVHQRATSVR